MVVNHVFFNVMTAKTCDNCKFKEICKDRVNKFVEDFQRMAVDYGPIPSFVQASISFTCESND